MARANGPISQSIVNVLRRRSRSWLSPKYGQTKPNRKRLSQSPRESFYAWPGNNAARQHSQLPKVGPRFSKREGPFSSARTTARFVQVAPKDGNTFSCWSVGTRAEFLDEAPQECSREMWKIWVSPSRWLSCWKRADRQNSNQSQAFGIPGQRLACAAGVASMGSWRFVSIADSRAVSTNEFNGLAST